MKKKEKLILKAGLAALLDMIALVVMLYIALNTMNVFVWLLTVIVCGIFVADATAAAAFAGRLLKK